MDKHVPANRPPTAFGGPTGLRLAPPGLLQVDRWKHLTEAPAVIKSDSTQSQIREDR